MFGCRKFPIFSLLIFAVTMVYPQFPTTTPPSTQSPSQNKKDENKKSPTPENPQQEPTPPTTPTIPPEIKLTEADVQSYQSIIDENESESTILTVEKPKIKDKTKEKSLWRFVEGIQYDKEKFLAAELRRFEKDENEDDLKYPLVRLYIRVFDTALLDHLYKTQKFKNWKEFFKKMLLEPELDPQNTFFNLEKTKVEKELIDSSYTIGGKKNNAIEYQIVGEIKDAPVSYRIRTIIFKDKQYTLVFRMLSQVVGKALTQTIEKEFLEILNNTTIKKEKKKKGK
jgi:hypothetical protein